MRTIQIKVREDFSYTIQTNYIDWDMFDNISPKYFSEPTIKFFNSKRYAEPVWSESEQGFCFVVSNRDTDSGFPRMYSVCKLNLRGQVRKIDTFKTLKQAEKELKALINGK